MPTVAAGMLGFILGIYAKPNQDGVYVSSPWVVLGREQTPIPELKLDTLSGADVSVLKDKIKALEPKSLLGGEVRKMAVATDGPFKRVPMDKMLRIRLNNDGKRIGDGIAKVCEGSPLENTILIAKDVVYPEGIKADGMISLHVTATDALCTDHGKLDSHDLWLDRDTLVEWVPNLQTLPEFWTPDVTVSANAVSVVSSY